MSRGGLRLTMIVVGALAGGVTLAFLFLREPGEELTHDALRQARGRWESEGPSAYRMEVRLDGGQEGRHRIEVRDGAVVRMETNGKPAAPHAWTYWSVDGMFRFLETELEHKQECRRAYGVEDPSRVVLEAHFDAELGHPRRFLRYVVGKGMQVEWEIVSFEPGG